MHVHQHEHTSTYNVRTRHTTTPYAYLAVHFSGYAAVLTAGHRCITMPERKHEARSVKVHWKMGGNVD